MWNFVAGYVLGVFSAFILLCLLLTHRAAPPTLAARKRKEVAECLAEPIEPLYMYGVTGEER